MIIDTKYELYISIFLIIPWTVLVALVSSATSGLAVDSDGAVYLGNMYYFTWASFINGILLLASIVESRFGISVRAAFENENGSAASTSNNENIKIPSMAFIYWFALMTTSIIVMGSSADIYNRNCEFAVDLKPQPFCSRTVFAITTGTIATIASLLIIVGKLSQYATPFLLEVLLSAVLFILYIFELFYATRADGPGSPLGNLYYFSWISFLLCFGIGKSCYDDYVYALELEMNEFEGQRSNRSRANVPSLQGRDVEDDHDEENGVQQQQQSRQYATVPTTGSPTSGNRQSLSRETKDDEPDIDI